jgi:truncated hemoglobin YjbI
MPSYEEVTERVGSLRAMTGLTEQEFSTLLPHFQQALQAYMEDHTRDGQPRTSRRYSSYETAPLPTVADKVLFILTSLKQNPLQEVPGQLFGMSQSHANTWIHLLHPGLNRALAHHDLLPARTADELATRLTTKPSKGESTTPRFGMRVRSDQSSVPKSPRTSRNTLGARRSALPSKISS